MKKFTHIDKSGRAKMVDVTGKQSTGREAVACGAVRMSGETVQLISDNKVAKGNVFETARLAGIMAAKRTSTLIPLCHQLNLTSVAVEFSIDNEGNTIEIESRVKCNEKTGVEMEALTAVSVAALTIYDMCKAVDKGMVISEIRLMKKKGGRSGEWKR